MKKILVIITTAFVKTGGLTSVMLNYWRAIDKTGISFDFASSNKIDRQLSEEIKKEGSQYYKLPPRENTLRYFIALKKLCKPYDIVHIHANSATSIIELIAAKITKVPKRIHHNHSSKTHHKFLNKLLIPLLKCSLTDAIACSEEAGTWLFGKDHYIILPNAINIEKYIYNSINRRIIRSEFGIKEDEFVVGHIGKFMDAKNHEFLINVFAKYHSKYPKSKLFLIGDGSWRPKIENWVKLSGCPDSIIIAGLRSDIHDIIQAFDIFVFPSLYEGLPLSVLEAQSSGLPCIISSNVTTAVNICNGVVMKNLSDGVDSWVKEIENVDFSISRENRCKQNYKLITDAHFNIKNEAYRLLELYNS